MCGRFTNRHTWNELVALYRLTDQGDPRWFPSYDIAPSELALVIRVNRDTGERKLSLLKWGLVPFWARDAKIAYSTINARADTGCGPDRSSGRGIVELSSGGAEHVHTMC
jgi:putative SOS response-associated peptidase YedK